LSRRRQARELAFRAAYQADVTGDPVEHCYREILEDLEEAADPVTRDFAGALVSTLALHQPEIDAVVSRLAAAELLYHSEVPVRVALDEAIEIAKKYGMETSGAFVNGILDRLAHDVRPPG